MQLTLDTQPHANVVTQLGPDGVRVGALALTRSFIVSSRELLPDWPVVDVRDLDVDALAAALALKPEILILGTGSRIQFPEAALYAALAEYGIGLEVMDTAAACRTYNVLVAEQREVVAAVILP